MTVLRVIEAFAHTVNGYPDVAAAGALFDSDDPVVKAGGPDRFEPVEVTATRDSVRRSGVEQATAAPGERRSLTRASAPRKRTAKKTAKKAAAPKKAAEKKS